MVKAGDVVELRRGHVWWPMKVCGWKGEQLRLLSDAHGMQEGEQLKKMAMLRPSWVWHMLSEDYSYKLDGDETRVKATRLEKGGTARIVGLKAGSEHGGLELELVEKCDVGRWRLNPSTAHNPYVNPLVLAP